MLQNPPAAITAPVTIRVEQMDLLSVTGRIDDPGLERLRCRLDELIEAGARLLVADLSGVDGCDGRLFELLARTEHRVGCRGGRLRLVGLSSPVLDALDQANLPDVLLVYRAARWAGHRLDG
jgi:anti-anti-sigma factor